MSAPSFGEPLYRARTELPPEAQHHTFGATTVAVTVTDTSAESLPAQWMAEREIGLTLLDEVSADELARLLPAFLDHARTLADRPAEAALTLPSRDIDRARAARAAGLWPTSVLAVADLHHGWLPPPRPDIAIREANAADTAAVTALWIEQAEYEARVGVLRISPGVRTAIAAEVEHAIAGPGTVLVADRAGPVLGAVLADPAGDSPWVDSRLMLAPVSYLAMASTAAAARGGGVGAALVTELHRRHVAAGVAASVLHYSVYNPLSVPFWSQRGYRPLLTSFAKPL